MSELLPCPFCGSAAEVNEWGGGFVPACSYLDPCCSGRMSGDKEKAIGRWNTRTQPAPDPLLDQMAEALAEAFGHLAAIGHPVDSQGRYHKDGEWTFADALPNPADGEEMLNAFNTIKSALSDYNERVKG